MAELPLSLSVEESEYLIELLKERLKEKRVEEHRTRTPSYRQRLVHQEELIEGLLEKLRQPTTALP